MDDDASTVKSSTPFPRRDVSDLRNEAPSPATASDEPERRVIDGDYELLEAIAQGGNGVVWRARQLSRNRLVALKMIRRDRLATAEETQRFQIEAKAAASLHHPNIVPIFDMGEDAGQHYFTMKLVEGRNLAETRTGQPMPTAQIARLLFALARAVHYAHKRHVIHRDLKPSNILIDCTGEPFLTDFGLAKLTVAGQDLTSSRTVMGTPRYMSPEQASGNSKNITGAADIYGLGVILYELLTGKPPFDGATNEEILAQVIQNAPVPPHIINAQVDPKLETICLKCLEKQPEKRFASAEDLAGELARVMRGAPIVARPLAIPSRIWRWCAASPTVAALVVVAALAVSFGSMGAWQWHRANRLEAQLREFLTKAERGDADAQFRLGEIFAAGSGVKRDYAQAARWYTAAAEQGLREAQLKLAELYLVGRGVPRDADLASAWRRRASRESPSSPAPTNRLAAPTASARSQEIPAPASPTNGLVSPLTPPTRPGAPNGLHVASPEGAAAPR